MNIETNKDITKARLEYILHLADTNLVLAQRLCEWCGHGPILEQDIALSNIALDILGQTRNLYQYAAEIQNEGKSEDDLAFFRTERQFKNLLLVEQPNTDFGYTILRQFLYSTYFLLLIEQLKNSADTRLAAIAEKSILETKYHYKWSAEWVIRLGDGTEESKQRMVEHIASIWRYVGEMFTPSPFENELNGLDIIPDYQNLKSAWSTKVKSVFDDATLEMPQDGQHWMQSGGKNGVHTEHLGYLLAEMQITQRQYPGLEW